MSTAPSPNSLSNMLAEGLRPVVAPEALWDRVWQPRVEVAQRAERNVGWMQGFAFGLPVAAAAALICMVAMSNPVHTAAGFHASAATNPGRPPSSQAVPPAEIVAQAERMQVVRVVSNERHDVQPRQRMTAASVDATGCGLCHAL
jgi:hypothetical protein